MKINSEHPCDTCSYQDKNCPYDCIFSSIWNDIWQPCENYNCMYNNSDVRCEFANKCGAYKGDGKPHLDFDEEEDEEDEEEEEEEEDDDEGTD